MPVDPQLSGSPRRGAESRFRLRRPLPRPTVPRLLRNGLMPSCRSSPSECLRRSSRSLLSERTDLPGFHPSSRHHRRYPPGSGFPAPAPCRPQAFSASRRFDPPSALRACFIPQPRPGLFVRPGVSPDPQPSRLVARRCPLAVVVRPLTGKPAATGERLGFEALLHGPMRSSERGLAAPSVAPLYGFSPPPGTGASVVSRAHPVFRS